MVASITVSNNEDDRTLLYLHTTQCLVQCVVLPVFVGTMHTVQVYRGTENCTGHAALRWPDPYCILDLVSIS